MSRPRVLVAGLGDAGVLTAIRLSAHVDVVGVTTKPEFVSGQELGLRLSRPESWMRDYRVAYDRFRGLDRVRIIHGEITALDPEARSVRIDLADGDSVDEPYDVLVIATGVTNGFWRQPDIQDTTEVDAGLATAHQRLTTASSVAIVGGGAAAVGCAAQIGERWPDKQVDLYFPGERALPHHHGRVWDRVARRLAGLGVGVHPGHRAVLPAEATRQLTTGEVTWSTGQPPAQADVVIWAVGQVRPNTSWLSESMLDERGFVPVHADLRVVGQEHLFAVGDVAATDPLRTSARNQGHKLVADNVRAWLDGKPLGDYRGPRRRWGSVLGPQRDGLTVFAPNGRRFRIPAWTFDQLLQPIVVRRGIYGGVRPNRASLRRRGRARTH